MGMKLGLLSLGLIALVGLIAVLRRR